MQPMLQQMKPRYAIAIFAAFWMQGCSPAVDHDPLWLVCDGRPLISGIRFEVDANMAKSLEHDRIRYVPIARFAVCEKLRISEMSEGVRLGLPNYLRPAEIEAMQ